MGTKVTGGNIADDAITGDHIADQAVDSDELAPNSVTGAKIADDAVGSDEIEDESIVSADIDDGTIATSDLADAAVTPAKLSQKLTSDTMQATTSGTAKDFTSIPSWVKRITVMLNGISTNGTSPMLVQIGSGSFDTTNYVGSVSSLPNGAAIAGANLSAGFVVANTLTSASTISGNIVLTHIGSNVWTCNGVTGRGNEVRNEVVAGQHTLSNTLDRLRLTMANGTDAFDVGNVNIMYE